MDISLPPEKYSELLILCAHDTHHDFFQPKETFEKIMSGGGRETDFSFGTTRPTARFGSLYPIKEEELKEIGVNLEEWEESFKQIDNHLLDKMDNMADPLQNSILGSILVDMVDADLEEQHNIFTEIIDDDNLVDADNLVGADLDDYEIGAALNRDVLKKTTAINSEISRDDRRKKVAAKNKSARAEAYRKKRSQSVENIYPMNDVSPPIRVWSRNVSGKSRNSKRSKISRDRGVSSPGQRPIRKMSRNVSGKSRNSKLSKISRKKSVSSPGQTSIRKLSRNVSGKSRNSKSKLDRRISQKAGMRPMRAVRQKLLEFEQKNLRNMKNKLINIIKKIRVWDMLAMKIMNSTDDPGTGNFTDIKMYNDQALQLDNDPDNLLGLYTFAGWINKIRPVWTPKSRILTDINGIPFQEYDMASNVLYTQTIEKKINGIGNITDFSHFMSDLMRFIKYTSIQYLKMEDDSTRLLLVNPLFEIDISTFIKKKWYSLGDKIDNTALKDKFNTFLKSFRKNKTPLLTPAETEQVYLLRDAIMRWWIDFAYPNDLDTPSGWVKDWLNLVGRAAARGETILDKKLVGFFMQKEYGIINSRGGIYDSNGVPMRDGIEEDLLNIAKSAEGSDSIGNNEASISHYVPGRYKPGEYPSKLQGHLFDHKKQYNCNIVNVADPGPNCPKTKCQSTPCGAANVTVGVTGGPKISFEIGTRQTNQIPSSINYSIGNQSGNKLENDFSLTGKEGLSKTNVLKEVFETMKEILVVQPGPGPVKYKDILLAFQSFLGDQVAVKKIVQIFSLKLFGDFGQELFSVKQSLTMPSVFIGNDWISSLRYLFMKKYMMNKSTQPWWGGFMGVSACFIIADNIPISGGKKKKLRSKKTKTKKSRKIKKKKRINSKSKRK